MNKNEYEIQIEIAYWLQSQGYLVTIEVPILGLHPDISAYSCREDSIMTIEVKISNWKRAIEQVRRFNMDSDYIAIAIASSKVPEKHFQYCQLKGIGIILYNNHPKWIFKPLRQERANILEYYRREYINRTRNNPAPINRTFPFCYPNSKIEFMEGLER